MNKRTEKAKKFLAGVMPGTPGDLEAMFETAYAWGVLEEVVEIARVPSSEQPVVRSTVDKLKRGVDLSDREQFALVFCPGNTLAYDDRGCCEKTTCLVRSKGWALRL